MRIRDLQMPVFVLMAASLSISCFGFWTSQHEQPDLSKRVILPWHPSGISKITRAIDFETASTLDTALKRPIFRISRRAFEPAAQIVAEAPVIVPSPAVVAPLPPPPIVEPPAVVAPQIAEAPPDVSQLMLKGIAIVKGKKQALIANSSNPEGAWLAIGAEISGWKLLALDKNDARLSLGGQIATLSLYVDNTGKLVGRP
jgi:hypothetical protein